MIPIAWYCVKANRTDGKQQSISSWDEFLDAIFKKYKNEWIKFYARGF